MPMPGSSLADDAPRSRVARFGIGLLSALLPGLGHLATGRRRPAAVFLAPVLIGIFVVGVIVATTDRFSLAASLIDPTVVWGILVVEALILVWRLVAVVSSMADRSFPRFARRTRSGCSSSLPWPSSPRPAWGWSPTRPCRPTAPSSAASRSRAWSRIRPDRRRPVRTVPSCRRPRRRPGARPVAAGHGPPHRCRLGCRPRHRVDRHDDRGQPRPGRRHRVDGVGTP